MHAGTQLTLFILSNPSSSWPEKGPPTIKMGLPVPIHVIQVIPHRQFSEANLTLNNPQLVCLKPYLLVWR